VADEPEKLTLSVTVYGNSLADLDLALERVRELVAKGYLSGFDMNDSARFQFEVVTRKQ